jgi:hypothetical protein
LRRINKGTSTVMNLEVMKTCAELGIRSLSNLIVDYPGSTKDEVDETVAVIDDFAFAYEPPNIATFELGIDSVVARFPEDNGIANVRKHERYADVLPPEVLSTLQTFQLSFDHVATADWSSVIERVARWKAEYRPDAYVYEDGGDFIRVVRRRPRMRREVFDLVGDSAALYRFCLRYRSLDEIRDLLAHSSDHFAVLEDELRRLVEQRLIYRWQDRHLAVAKAPDTSFAARRIRAHARALAARPQRTEPRRLLVVS